MLMYIIVYKQFMFHIIMFIFPVAECFIVLNVGVSWLWIMLIVVIILMLSSSGYLKCLYSLHYHPTISPLLVQISVKLATFKLVSLIKLIDNYIKR